MRNYSLLKKVLKVGLNLWQAGVVVLGRALGYIDFPVPPNSSIRKTGGWNIRSYYLGGLRTALPLMACARREGVRLDENIRVLDFGCGVGRPLLHFTRTYPKPLYHACDVDDTSVDFISRNYPQVQARVTKFTPPLPYEAAFFDLIYSVSIFSHLSIEDQKAWLTELARITKPGGWCLLSTEGLTSLEIRCAEMGKSAAAVEAELNTNGYYYREYPEWTENVRHQNTLRVTSLMVGIERSYGSTILTSGFIHEHWPKAGFQVRAIVPGIIDGQDLVILLRKASPAGTVTPP